MDVYRIEQAVAVPPNALFLLVAIPLRFMTADRAGVLRILAELYKDTGSRLILTKFCPSDIPRFLKAKRPRHCLKEKSSGPCGAKCRRLKTKSTF